MFDTLKKIFKKGERIDRENGAYDIVMSETLVHSYVPGTIDKSPAPPLFDGRWERLTDVIQDTEGFTKITWVREDHHGLLHIYTYTDSRTKKNIDIQLEGRCDYSEAMRLLRKQVNTFHWYLTNEAITISKKK